MRSNGCQEAILRLWRRHTLPVGAKRASILRIMSIDTSDQRSQHGLGQAVRFARYPLIICARLSMDRPDDLISL